MKVLLCQDVENLGWYGDVVEVKQGYARNYLIPQCIATAPSEAKIKAMAEEKASRAAERQKVSEKLQVLAERVEGAEVVIAAKVNEQGHLFGSVSEKDIATNLADQGFEVTDKNVKLSEHIKEVGEHEVTLKFVGDIAASIKVTIVAEGGQPEQDVEVADESAEETTE